MLAHSIHLALVNYTGVSNWCVLIYSWRRWWQWTRPTSILPSGRASSGSAWAGRREVFIIIRTEVRSYKFIFTALYWKVSQLRESSNSYKTGTSPPIQIISTCRTLETRIVSGIASAAQSYPTPRKFCSTFKLTNIGLYSYLLQLEYNAIQKNRFVNFFKHIQF